MGLQASLELLTNIFGLELDIDPVREEAERQRQALDETAAEDARLQVWLKELELAYDMEARRQPENESAVPPLSPSLEKFLHDVERRWDQA